MDAREKRTLGTLKADLCIVNTIGRNLGKKRIGSRNNLDKNFHKKLVNPKNYNTVRIGIQAELVVSNW